MDGWVSDGQSCWREKKNTWWWEEVSWPFTQNPCWNFKVENYWKSRCSVSVLGRPISGVLQSLWCKQTTSLVTYATKATNPCIKEEIMLEQVSKRDLKCMMCLRFISGMFCHVVCAVLVYHLNCSKWPLFEWGQWRLHWCDDSIKVSHAERINLFSQSCD